MLFRSTRSSTCFSLFSSCNARVMEKQKESPQRRCIEFYSGIGGLHYALLLTECEGEVVAAYDLNNLANAIYEHNFPSCKVKTVWRTARQRTPFPFNVFLLRRTVLLTLFTSEKPGNCDRQRTRCTCGQRLAYVPPLSGFFHLLTLVLSLPCSNLPKLPLFGFIHSALYAHGQTTRQRRRSRKKLHSPYRTAVAPHTASRVHFDRECSWL